MKDYERISEALYKQALAYSRLGYMAERRKQPLTHREALKLSLLLIRKANQYQRWSIGHFTITERLLLALKII